jgi:hypothetical protein
MAGDVSSGAGEEHDTREVPAGIRMALFGAVLYLSEWVAILAASPPGPFGPGVGRREIVSTYADHDVGASPRRPGSPSMAAPRPRSWGSTWARTG